MCCVHKLYNVTMRVAGRFLTACLLHIHIIFIGTRGLGFFENSKHALDYKDSWDQE